MHAKKDLSDPAKQLALKLFDDYNCHISTNILLEAQEMYRYATDFDKPSLFSSLHCASFFGIVEIVASLLQTEGCDINQLDCGGSTPLIWAGRNGHEGVVEILLGRIEVNPDKPGDDGRTQLWWAAYKGHEGVVKMLLGRNVNPDKPNINGRTPLYLAAWNGQEGVVKILPRRTDVNPNKLDKDGETPLDRATK